MNDISWPIAALYASACLGLSLSVLGRVYRSIPAANPFSLTYLIGALWCMFYAFEIQSLSLEQKLFWFRARFLLLSPAALVVLELTYRFIYGRPYFTKWKLAAGLVIPLATSVLSLTIDRSPIFLYDFEIETSGRFDMLEFKIGPWHWVFFIFNYTLVIYSIVMLIQSMAQAAPWARRARILFLVGRLIPLVLGAAYYFDFMPTDGMNYTPMSLGVTGILVAIAVFGDRMGMLSHVARYALVEKLNDLLIVLDPQQRIVDLNRAAARVFKVSQEQAHEKPVQELFHDNPTILEAIASRTQGSIEIHQDGQDYELTVIPVETHAKDQSATLLHFHDITRLKAAEEASCRARQIAEDADQAKGRYLAIMSHELRSPLNSVLGFMGMLERTPLNNEQAEFISHVTHSGNSLLAIINEVLDHSKIEAGRLELINAPFDLIGELSTLCGTLKLEAQKKGLDLLFSVPAETPSAVYGDKNRLAQIVRNLLSNAIKFTPSGYVAVELACVDREFLGGQEIYSFACTVRDTGIGISEEGITHLFQPFSQVIRTDNLQYGGTGLGLVIARSLCELMGGGIQVESVPGRGSVFTARFKLQQSFDLVPLQPIPLPPEPPPFTPLRIMVIDDQPINRRLLQVMLTRLKHKVELVESGAACLSLLKLMPFDVLIMDVEMPGMDGLETTRRIREYEKEIPLHPRPHIIALTAHAFADIREKCLQAGMDDYASKPITISVLERTLDGVVTKCSPGELDGGLR